MRYKLDAPFYCGVGSRETPDNVLIQMEGIARILKDMGYVLRSGHADGADKAFERGSQGVNQIWLPWKGFNYRDEENFPKEGHFHIQDNWVADKLAQHYHPNWKSCSDGAKKLHTRNVYQVLGPGLGVVETEKISRFVICWTKDGKASGGTGQALRIAHGYERPVFNLYNADALDKLEKFLTNGT